MEELLEKEQKIWDLEGEEVFQWEIATAKLSKGKMEQKRIVPYYEKVVERWKYRWSRKVYWLSCLDLVEKRENSRVFFPWKATFSPELLYLEDVLGKPLLSVGLTVTEQRGKQLQQVCFFSDLWDYQEGIPLSPKHIAKEQWGTSKEIIQAIQKQGELREDFLFLPDYSKRIAQYFAPKQLYLTKEGGIYHFPQGAIASKVEAVPKFFLPFGEK